MIDSEHEWTNQELFDHCCKEFRDKDYRRCVIITGACRYYNSEDGNRCIIGKCLPLETAKSFERVATGVVGILNVYPKETQHLQNINRDLATILQYIHDRIIGSEKIEVELEHLAKRFYLVYVRPQA